jgi:hypothetical protein
MIRPLAIVLAPALVAVLCSAPLQADDKEAGQTPGTMMFKRLDKNQDGKVTADEIPEAAPEVIKGMLKRADKNQDKEITAEEFRAAIRHFHPSARPGAPHGHRPGPPSSPSDRVTPKPGERGPQTDRRPPHSGHPMFRGAPSGPKPGAAGPQRPMPDPKAIFQKLDRDKDQKLNLEEFTIGMRELHRRVPTARPMPGGPKGFRGANVRGRFHGPRPAWGPWMMRRPGGPGALHLRHRAWAARSHHPEMAAKWRAEMAKRIQQARNARQESPKVERAKPSKRKGGEAKKKAAARKAAAKKPTAKKAE